MFGNSVHDSRIAELERRVMRLEQQVELLLGRAGFGSAMSMGVDETAIEHLLRRGNKIEAIKVYREKTGAGLKEAKDAVEAIERRLR
jgi:ribosomal protein L7/L12